MKTPQTNFLWAVVFLTLLSIDIRAIHAEKIIFAYPSPSTSFLPLVVAQKRGFFEPENLQPELVQIRPAIAPDSRERGLHDRAWQHDCGANAWCAAGYHRRIRRQTDGFSDRLQRGRGAKRSQGKIVGISALGTATHFLTVRVLKAIGLDAEKDVTLRAVGDEGLRLQALATGLVQASLLGSQGVIEGEKTGLKVIVAAADVIDSLPFAGVTTTLAKLKDNPQQIKRVLRAGMRGVRYVQENRAGTIDVIANWYRVERDIAAATYDLARKSSSANGEVSEKGVMLSMEFARASGKFDKETSPSEITDFSLVREVKKELAWG